MCKTEWGMPLWLELVIGTGGAIKDESRGVVDSLDGKRKDCRSMEGLGFLSKSSEERPWGEFCAET